MTGHGVEEAARGAATVEVAGAATVPATAAATWKVISPSVVSHRRMSTRWVKRVVSPTRRHPVPHSPPPPVTLAKGTPVPIPPEIAQSFQKSDDYFIYSSMSVQSQPSRDMRSRASTRTKDDSSTINDLAIGGDAGSTVRSSRPADALPDELVRERLLRCWFSVPDGGLPIYGWLLPSIPGASHKKRSSAAANIGAEKAGEATVTARRPKQSRGRRTTGRALGWGRTIAVAEGDECRRSGSGSGPGSVTGSRAVAAPGEWGDPDGDW
ncbi:hypothetical protein BC827DRAFT_1157722 [Russula dissimulans]|nr:hypothetical protein BC827DRAFT_1157722 [Russula dissimulans]